MPLSENEELARALGVAAHPLRLDILEAFIDGLVRSPTEAALALGQSLPNVSHHIRVLQREGFLAQADVAAIGRGPHGRYAATDHARVLVDALSSLA
jgi:DNA-binding transcriptional ArsR family regulator